MSYDRLWPSSTAPYADGLFRVQLSPLALAGVWVPVLAAIGVMSYDRLVLGSQAEVQRHAFRQAGSHSQAHSRVSSRGNIDLLFDRVGVATFAYLSI